MRLRAAIPRASAARIVAALAPDPRNRGKIETAGLLPNDEYLTPERMREAEAIIRGIDAFPNRGR
jgi:hypothetical protein